MFCTHCGSRKGSAHFPPGRKTCSRKQGGRAAEATIFKGKRRGPGAPRRPTARPRLMPLPSGGSLGAASAASSTHQAPPPPVEQPCASAGSAGPGGPPAPLATPSVHAPHDSSTGSGDAWQRQAQRVLSLLELEPSSVADGCGLVPVAGWKGSPDGCEGATGTTGEAGSGGDGDNGCAWDWMADDAVLDLLLSLPEEDLLL